ncbi:hypothetical protein LJU02_10150 [Corynebacterium pseudotuberculosis]|uniref:Secreted protein n=1 Tax=Corynebacterium pseudotuberculosis 258 TaxID=1168865 RepID=A0AAU8PQB0_CORPS|nr:membrane protein [Corynebacterium pseudotuberculosis]AER69973.1 Hypothetical protein Cp106_1940 [Corynebacterium pseudotuberculosis 1/06-A]AEQ07508.1 hypothetical protein CPCIP5297_10250 [Corynebacterium pseudotuberculosis CIP 52.97]AFB73319.2 hypothetical protein CP316_10240 [Corynebacterium pseudotuberculosis 316]AFH91773.2 hypothetical protein CP31_10455 [Corynebacterium pseudotuberculosis 31]AFK17616.1 hypothetical protein CP258_10250 [Corynebacterium pseudotuberculosis 258]
MKNNRILSLTISALATASVFTTSSLVVTSPLVTAVASAQTHDAMPGKYYIEPADDARDYLPMLKAYVSVAKLRHVYHTATGAQKFEKYPGTQEQRTAHEESERACYVAKARVALAILQVEGDVDARALDISKVGIDLETTKKAIPLLKKVKSKYWDLSFKESDSNRDKYANTHKIANDGLDRLEGIVNAETADENERNAFSIADWGVEDRFVTPLLEQHHLDSDEKALKTYKANLGSSEKAKMDEEAKSSGELNQTMLLKKHGGSDTLAPKPQEKPEKHKEETEKPASEKPKADAEKPKAEPEKPKAEHENKAPEAKDEKKVESAETPKAPKTPQISWSPITWPSWLKVIVSLGGVGLLAGLVHILLPFLPH